ncbi:uncharacterized protein [Aegilops tauschii subsp. strangulata]|uniref:uncharacterized protein n=1 Tax=Aegilops tauschii subsp. strangulata TaxID=200361 RepID=UPI003CC891DD
MEEVDGLMKGLRLSVAERRGLKIGANEKKKGHDWVSDELQAVGRLLSERPAHAGVVEHTLGRIWRPIKGVDCKELEENTFLFMFRQASGWTRALEDGPWWFDKELLVMEEFDPDKTVEEYEFNIIPMWIRDFGLPLGSMNRDTGELIGKDFHDLVEVDVGHDGKAAGKFLRIKVKLDIKLPLMRGFVLEREEEKTEGTRMEELLCHIDTRVTPAMNELLCKEFTEKEVLAALDSIGDLKAPGPDGMPSLFYKKCWDIVGDKVLHENKRKGRDGFAAIKLDMSKAYDRVEWKFLEKMMEKMGFDRRWIDRIMLCISSVSYRVKINGFSSLLNKADEDGSLKGLKLCSTAPSLNHLLFADDSLVLMKANGESAKTLQHVLELYENCSGQMINFDKSSVMFSKNTRSEDRQVVLNILNIRADARTEKYLGLPVYVGAAKTQIFEYLKDRIWKKIQGWIERLLSRAAKDVLIKACAQAIPTFAMSCFDLTKSLCEQMGAMICRYWWAQQDDMKKVHWLSWELLTRPKSKGGMGFRDLHGFNLAMLARQAWRMLTVPDSLCARLLKAKYFPDTSILDAQPKVGISYTWRSILKGVQLLKEGVIWRVGDGTNINIWSGPWLAKDGTRRPRTPRGNCVLTTVSELIDPMTMTWDEQLVRDIFWPEDAVVILATPIKEDFEDFHAWHYDGRGQFSVKSAYQVYIKARDDAAVPTTINPVQPEIDWKKLWDIPCPPKVQQFLWRLAHNSVPVKSNISHKGIECDTLCLCCRRLDEDGCHLFIRCKEVKKLWREMQLEDVRLRLCACANARQVVQQIITLREQDEVLVACMLWKWWNQRNKLNKGEKICPVENTAAQVRSWALEHLQRKMNSVTERTARPACRWTKPDGDQLKINVDGAFHNTAGSGGWGFVIRDNTGDAVGAGAGKIQHAVSAIQTEAEACLQALSAAAVWGISNIVVESDCQTLLHAVQSSEYDRAPEGVLFRDIRQFIRLNFSTFAFPFVPRD